MAHICSRKIRCENCEHYRFDAEYGGNSCFAVNDIEKDLEIIPESFRAQIKVYILNALPERHITTYLKGNKIYTKEIEEAIKKYY